MKFTKDFTLILASICFIIVLGASIYEHVVIVPQWSAGPPASLSIFQGPYGLHPEHFWIPIHPITLFFLGASLIANWYTTRRKKILIVIGSYIIILAVTFAFFVPELIKITGSPFQETVSPELLRRASLWQTLSLIRLSIIAILSIVLLSSLPRSHEKINTRISQSAPLNYENDSLGG